MKLINCKATSSNIDVVCYLVGQSMKEDLLEWMPLTAGLLDGLKNVFINAKADGTSDNKEGEVAHHTDEGHVTY